jgi:hypothetical protein
MMMGRSNTEVFFAGFGTWIHGGALFFGDIRAGAQALAHQVMSQFFILNFTKKWILKYKYKKGKKIK